MAIEPMKTSTPAEAAPNSGAEYFYSAASVIESDRYRWFMQDLDRVEAQLKYKFENNLSIRVQLAIKRGIDIVGSFFLIVLLAPVFLLTALAVRLTSPGPITYNAKRWALNQGHFICLKFRSMRTDQHKIMNTAEVQEMQRNGILLKLKKDPRLTAIGSFIRKTSIDELPQLFNVLKGDMSLVGPRPLVLHMMQPYPKVRRVRCMMRPGITGLWQIRDRENNTSVIGMMPHDLDYLLNFNLWLDIKILLATFPAVLWGTGAC
jgi:lipopolysaccharide/colanic/teichoic acid biosynthesis glycosyltransferase